MDVELTQCFLQVLQPWDDTKFNFTKALQKEVLFQFEASDMPTKGSSFVPLAPVSGEGQPLNAGVACMPTCVHLHMSAGSMITSTSIPRKSWVFCLVCMQRCHQAPDVRV